MLQGRPYVADVKEGDLWYFPAGLPHSLQGLGPDGAEFVLAFDNGASSEFNTLPATDWMAHTPPEVLAKNFGVPAEAFKNIPLAEPLDLSGQGAGAARRGCRPRWRARRARRSSRSPSRWPVRRRSATIAGGFVQIADSSNFHVAKTVAAGLVTIRPGGIRTMHWHPNADEWQYYLKGTGRMTVFNAGPSANTANFRPGDIGYVRKGLGHYIENTGDSDLVMVAVFRSPRYEEVSFSDWLAHSPARDGRSHLQSRARDGGAISEKQPRLHARVTELTAPEATAPLSRQTSRRGLRGRAQGRPPPGIGSSTTCSQVTSSQSEASPMHPERSAWSQARVARPPGENPLRQEVRANASTEKLCRSQWEWLQLLGKWDVIRWQHLGVRER